VLKHLNIRFEASAIALSASIMLALGLFGCGGASNSSHTIVPPVTAATPTFSAGAGSYAAVQTVSMTSSTPLAIICWNTTGSPASNGAGTGCNTGTMIASGASVTVSASETVYAIAGTATLPDSSVAEAAYAIGVASASFGFQCGDSANAGCPNFTLPAAPALPGVLRLWDSSTQWNALNATSGQYDWNSLDSWLDTIHAQGLSAVYTFGWTPYWDAPSGSCQTDNTSKGSPCPPTDLTSQGSDSFNAFVSALVAHCSPAGNCVSNNIQYFELWNEPNAPVSGTGYWTGTVAQLYQMMAPAVTIIRQAIPTAQILGPPITDNPGFDTWECSWLSQEVTNGVLSNIYGFHGYLQDLTPEAKVLVTQTQVALNLTPGASCSLPGWTPQPFWLTETNFTNSEGPSAPYTCDSTLYTADDCAGQVARWQILVNALGGFNVTWYSWENGVGSVPENASAYASIMQYLNGGTFPGPCSPISGTQTWTCNFTEANGTNAQFVWTPNEAGASYTVPSGYTDYKDLNGNTTSVSTGQTITVGVEPFMLEM
jgi:hypothetical protein